MSTVPDARPAHWLAGLLLPALLLAAQGCDPNARQLRMETRSYPLLNPDQLEAVFAEQSRVLLDHIELEPGLPTLEALSRNDVDLGLVENSAAFTPGVRAVLPVFKSVLHVLIRDGYVLKDGASPLRNASFHVMNQSAAGTSFVELVTRRQGLQAGDYRMLVEPEPGAADFIIYFGPVNPEDTSWFQPGYSLISITDQLDPERRFYTEGIGHSAPKMSPLVIPPLTYLLPGNDRELQTLSVDTLLVVRREAAESAVYELTRTLLEQKPRLVAIAPHLFSGINESFDPLDLSFPLHSGARRYLQRDEPGLLERYAETINMLAYMTFLLLTGVLALARWRGQRKKDRIDTFYTRVLAIRSRIRSEDAAKLLAELLLLEREAFAALIDERLAANESFRIFTDLLADSRRELRARLPLDRKASD